MQKWTDALREENGVEVQPGCWYFDLFIKKLLHMLWDFYLFCWDISIQMLDIFFNLIGKCLPLHFSIFLLAMENENLLEKCIWEKDDSVWHGSRIRRCLDDAQLLLRVCSFFVSFRFFKWSTNLRFSSFCVSLVTFVSCKWKLTCVSHVPRWLLPQPFLLSCLCEFYFIICWCDMRCWNLAQSGRLVGRLPPPPHTHSIINCGVWDPRHHFLVYLKQTSSTS